MNEDFLHFLENNKQKILIEVEGNSGKILEFIDEHNYKYRRNISTNTIPGVCILKDVDKWNVQLRIYFNNLTNIPSFWENKKYRNKAFRADEFKYRLDDGKLANYLFDNGYNIGYNF